MKGRFPMTILHIITRMILGGAQRNTVLTCGAQVTSGHRVWLAHGPVYGPEGSILPEIRHAGIQLAEVPSLRRPVTPLHDYSCTRALRRLIRQVRPDVVHTHSSKAGILGRAAAWNQHVPVVVHTVHGLPFHDNQSAPINAVYLAAERWAARRCHRIICVSRAMQDACLQHRIGKPAQFKVIHNGFDVAAYAKLIASAPSRATVRRDLGVPPEAKLVGIVARLDRHKGQDDLLDVLKALRGAFADVRLLFVGDGWHSKALRRRVARNGWQQHVIFTGMVSFERVISLLGAMDVMALPSYREGLPRTLVEALLCGCAIVSYDVDGIGEVCIDGQTGRLVSKGDHAALGRAIEWQLAHDGERLAMVETGRRMVRKDFDIHTVVAQTEQVYKEVLTGHTQCRSV